jgi:hypothetical protein
MGKQQIIERRPLGEEKATSTRSTRLDFENFPAIGDGDEP